MRVQMRASERQVHALPPPSPTRQDGCSACRCAGYENAARDVLVVDGVVWGRVQAEGGQQGLCAHMSAKMCGNAVPIAMTHLVLGLSVVLIKYFWPGAV
jgi:hypothetical protein